MAKKPKNEELQNSQGVAVRFTVSPVGPYGLGYFAGDVAEIDALLAEVIVENGHAEYCEAPTADVTTEEAPIAEAPTAQEETTEENTEVTE